MAACPAAIARCERHQKYIVRTWRTRTSVQQAAALHISLTQVRRLRMRLLAAGVVSETTRAYTPRWPTDAARRITAMLHEGYTVDQIGQAFNRTGDAVLLFCAGRGIPVSVQTVGAIFTVSELSRLLNVPYQRVRAWRDALGVTTADKKRWRVTRAQLCTFFADRRFWPFYRPDAVRDPELAAAARFERLRAGGDWIPLAAWAKQEHIAASTARAWCRAGRVDALLHGGWFVWQVSEAQKGGEEVR